MSKIKNVAMFLTALEESKKKSSGIKLEPQSKKSIKSYGLPKGFKLIGFNITV